VEDVQDRRPAMRDRHVDVLVLIEMSGDDDRGQRSGDAFVREREISLVRLEK